ncbi:MAG: polysaccharide biosynthesis protein, partial [Candidatus Thermoplasmatota archaeon]|nr:polysaccharide biosynthesis protein [Candidatus Thermoplasmatota archaeon]
KRYFMTLPEASQLVIQAGALGKGEKVLNRKGYLITDISI